MNAITTRNLTRSFGKLTAVDRLNIQVPAGSLYGLIGPNGAGKTTTLRMLAGLLEPTSGEIRINELAIRQYWQEVRWQIGFMPDFFGVYEDLLVWEYLDFFARCYRLAPERRKKVVDELLDLLDLSEKRDAPVQTLSRGMHQRLCLAHALVHDPQILLLDEPASGLDPRARVEMRELLRELSSMGKTILLSSHILSELAELCDWVGIIERGQLVVSGPLIDIHNRLGNHRMLRLRALSDPVAVENVLRDHPKIHDIQITKGNNSVSEYAIDFSGGDHDVADLLDQLIARRIRILSYHEVVSDLEETFLRLTKGEVA